MTNYQRTTWRLIETPAAYGSWNMAVDEAILEAVLHNHTPPTLRLYSWEPPCLSLGYAQPIADVDQNAIVRMGWHLVRRPTGGRAILHTDELTYAVIGHQSEPRLAGGVLETYHNLSQALLTALKRLEIPVQTFDKPDTTLENPGTRQHRASSKQNPVCFVVKSNYEISVRGKKLIGSAQARRKGGVLQHGSLPLHGDLQRIIQALTFQDDDARSKAAAHLDASATTVEQALGYTLSWRTVSQVLISAFEDTLNLDFQKSQLTLYEIEKANELIEEKYAHPDWTNRV